MPPNNILVNMWIRLTRYHKRKLSLAVDRINKGTHNCTMYKK